MKSLLLTCLLMGLAWGQTPGASKSNLSNGTVITSGSTITSHSLTFGSSEAPPDKKCAFGLKAQWVLWRGKSKPPNPKQEFDDASDGTILTFVESVYRDPRRASCPYERAIELFGEERVRFEEGMVGGDPPKEFKRIYVDSELVYEER